MTWKDRPVDEKFLLDSGLLFEINRQILHLVGIAIAFKRDEKGNLILTFKDSRDKPAELTFSRDALIACRKKTAAFMHEFGNSQIDKRTEVLGVGCQWVPCNAS